MGIRIKIEFPHDGKVGWLLPRLCFFMRIGGSRLVATTIDMRFDSSMDSVIGIGIGIPMKMT